MGIEVGRSVRTAEAVDGQAAEDALLARIRAGDERAFELLFRAYYEPLCAFVLGYLGSREQAEDRVHDVLFRFWQHRADCVVRHGLKQYLYGAARNEALNSLRHQRVVERWAARAMTTPDMTGMGDGPEGPDHHVERREIERALAAAMARLPERRRMVITLRLHHRFTNAEIASMMGISVKGVEMAITKALRTLRDDLAGLL